MSPNLAHLTPEALLGRNDSKNPATTCRGITSSGRPCRRALASPRSSPNSRRGSSMSALNSERDGQAQDVFYCWQHKDQVRHAIRESRDDSPTVDLRKARRSIEILPLQERNSIDTFVQRLGLDNTVGERKQSRRGKVEVRRDPSDPVRNARTRGPTTKSTNTGREPGAEKENPGSPERRTVRKPQQKPRGFWASLCCTSNDDGDYMEVVRHRKRVGQTGDRPGTAHLPPPSPDSPLNRPTSTTTRPSRAPLTASAPPTLPIRPSPPDRNPSNPQTGDLLSLIPPHLSPQTASLLLTELIKPLSPSDEEGYIYIFWLTPQTRAAPPEAAARSLLAVPGPPGSAPARPRRPSDVMTEYSSAGSEPQTRGKRTIMLKIGRANNVTRRMNEWQRQCGYALTLVRWYPYVPSSSSPSPSSPAPSPRGGAGVVEYPDLSLPRPPPPSTEQDGAGGRRRSAGVRKVACIKRVERLIHLELAERQVRRQCGACGREHREWFEVEATRAGVRAVDECVRRWVAWAEERAGG